MPTYRGRYEESGGEKEKETEEDKSQNMKDTHLLGGCLFGAFFTVKLGIFWDFWPKHTHQEGLEP